MEVNKTLEKYIHLVPFFTKISVRSAYKTKLASIACEKGLKAYFDGKRSEAFKNLKKACKIKWTILFYKNGLSLWLRLVLPKAIKGRILKK